MKKGEFLFKIEKYRPIVRGNGRVVAKLAGVEHQDYTYAMNGRNGDETLLSKIYNAIVSYSTKVMTAAA